MCNTSQKDTGNILLKKWVLNFSCRLLFKITAFLAQVNNYGNLLDDSQQFGHKQLIYGTEINVSLRSVTFSQQSCSITCLNCDLSKAIV